MVTVEGAVAVAVVAAERTRRRNGMQATMNPHRPRMLIYTIEGLPLQNLAVL